MSIIGKCWKRLDVAMGQLLLASGPLCLWTARKDGVGSHLDGHFLVAVGTICSLPSPCVLLTLLNVRDILLVVPVAAGFLWS